MFRAKITFGEGEKLRRDLHRHWKAIIMPTFWVALLVGLLTVALVYLPSGQATYILLGIPFLVLISWRVIWPFFVWRGARYVFTNERIQVYEGVVRKQRHDIILAQVNDVKRVQNLLDRILGSGTLTVQFAEKKDPYELKGLPHIKEIHDEVSRQLVEAERKKQARDERFHDAVTNLVNKASDAKVGGTLSQAKGDRPTADPKPPTPA